MNKKGVELAVSSIVIIILAIIVLVILAVGFTTGWSNVWDKINVFGGDEKESAIDACQISCSKQNNYAFCEELREIDSKGTKQTCVDLKVNCPGITCA